MVTKALTIVYSFLSVQVSNSPVRSLISGWRAECTAERAWVATRLAFIHQRVNLIRTTYIKLSDSTDCLSVWH